mmetsp:Transcript_2256/g.2911  ORF Transcript_2256/g.2911 Transcript_2256/m.2911 type:complete len:112 (+) Transcript_2256:143-478(+)
MKAYSSHLLLIRRSLPVQNTNGKGGVRTTIVHYHTSTCQLASKYASVSTKEDAVVVIGASFFMGQNQRRIPRRMYQDQNLRKAPNYVTIFWKLGSADTKINVGTHIKVKTK